MPAAVAGLALAVAFALWAAAALGADGAALLRAAGLIVLVVGLFASGVVPEYLTTLVFFLLAVTVVGAPPVTVFSGFQSAAAWLIFGGIVLGVAVQATGLGAWIAARLIALMPSSYLGALAGVIAVAAVLSTLMPSSAGRVIVLLPIVLALADRMGFEPGSNGRTALVLVTGTASLVPGFGILPATVPSIVLHGAAESVHGISFSYGTWLTAIFPVYGIAGAVVLALLAWRMLPDRQRRAVADDIREPLPRPARRVLAILVAALALWMTDFVHHVSPGWIALGAALACLVPRFGVLPAATLLERVNLGPWLYIAGVIGIGAFVTRSGLGDAIGRSLFALLPLVPGEDARSLATVTAVGMGVGLVSTVPAQPGIMAALAPAVAAGTGWPMKTVLIAIAASWSMTFFPYQLPPVVVAMRLGALSPGRVIRFLVWLNALSWIVLLSLFYLWWRAIGLL